MKIILEKSKKEMTLEEARALYEELHEIFDKEDKQPIIIYPSFPIYNPRPIWDYNPLDGPTCGDSVKIGPSTGTY